MLGLACVPLVAVLPFRDASGGSHGAVGEATAALIADELAQAGVAVVPRETLAAALEAQKLDPLHTEPSAQAAARLEKALGASALVSGAFDARSDRLAIWTRALGKRGAVTATATASGRPEEVLSTVHAADLELSRALALEPAALKQLKAQPRARLTTLPALELYGHALGEHEAEARRDLLQRALDADPTFEPASRLLEATERRLPLADAEAAAFVERAAADALTRWKQRLAAESDAAKLTGETLERFAELQKQHRWHTLIAEATAVMTDPPPPVPQLSEQLPESAHYLIVSAWDQLNDDDAVLREGHRFLARHPLSNGYPVVRQLVDQALERKRARKDGVAQAANAIAALPPADRDDPCKLGPIYDDASQLLEARKAYEACLQRPGAHDDALVKLLWVDFHLGDFTQVSLLIDRVRKQAPLKFPTVARIVDELPAD